MHLAILYPYLLPLMEQYVFVPLEVAVEDIRIFTKALYEESFRINNYEGIVYALYFSVRYRFEIDDINCDDLIKTGDCLCDFFAWLYYRKRGEAELAALEQEAKRMAVTAMDRNWLFCYEVLNASDLPAGDWQNIKNVGVSFIKQDYIGDNADGTATTESVTN